MKSIVPRILQAGLCSAALTLTCAFLSADEAFGAGIVSVPTQESLLAALQGGGDVSFNCNGTITLTNTIEISTDTRIDAGNQSIKISGGDTCRVFHIASNVTCTIKGITISNGRASSGAGILNSGALTIQDCVFRENKAIGQSGGTNLWVAGEDAVGGALMNNGTARIENSVFLQNGATGGDGGLTGPGVGLQLSRGGIARGGAIYNAGILRVVKSSFADSYVHSGKGGDGASGGSFTVTGGSWGGDAEGGALFNLGFSRIEQVGFYRNESAAGSGGTGGSSFAASKPWGPGPGGAGGHARGGAIMNRGSMSIINGLFIAGSATGGNGGASGGAGTLPTQGGSGGNAFGGAVVSSNSITLVHCTIYLNSVMAGNGADAAVPGTNGLATGSSFDCEGGLFVVKNSIVAAGNTANCAGAIIDGGFNILTDSHPNFTNTGTLTNTDPLLDYPFSVSLQSNSPAIDAVTRISDVRTDLSGVSRPQGEYADIGAVEFVAAPNSIAGKTLQLTVTNGSGFFSPTGAFRIIPSAETNTYRLVGLDSAWRSTGTYAYTRLDTTNAVLTFQDSGFGTNPSFSAEMQLSFGLPNTFATSSDINLQSGTFRVVPTDEVDILWQTAAGTIASSAADKTNILYSTALNDSKPVGSEWISAAFADFNGDGREDLLWQRNDGQMAVWLRDNRSFSQKLFLRKGHPAGSTWRSVGAQDFNGDGKNDVLFQHTNGALALWLFDGTNFISSFSLRNGQSAGSGWKAVATADLSGDGFADILFQHTSGKLAAWLLTGTNFTSSVLLRGGQPAANGWRVAGTRDVDQDGNIDIVWENTAGRRAVWFMEGTNFKQSVSLQNTASTPAQWKILDVR